VQILHPSNYMSLVDGQPVTVAGQATDRGGAEPVLIDSVTLQVDGGTPVRATLTRSHDATHTIANFTATVTVGGASGPHTITATATNDSNISVRRSVTVFIGPVFQTAAPAILLDVEVPFDVDANDRSVQSLLANIQHGLVPISDVLAASGMLLAGPNLQVIPNGALSLLRLGLWIEPNTFPVQPPTGTWCCRCCPTPPRSRALLSCRCCHGRIGPRSATCRSPCGSPRPACRTWPMRRWRVATTTT
jgi:hypothetical protein